MSKIDLTNNNDDFANLPDGILYRKDSILQVVWNNGIVETWSQPCTLKNAVENFESMASRWHETDFSKQRRTFNKFASGYLKNITNGAK